MKFLNTLFLLLAFFGLNIASLDAQTGVLIPYYVYPTSSALAPLINAKVQHPSVPMRVILNPNSGVGTSQDPTYVSATTNLKLNNIQVLGYVDTAYITRAIGDVMQEILLWNIWYQPSGIFLDSMGAAASYYSELKTFINSLGMTVIVGNAGQNVDPDYGDLVNTVVIADSNGLPNLNTYCNWSSVPASQGLAGFLIYDVPTLPVSFIKQIEPLAGWLYVTSGTNPNPWNGLPSYFNNLMVQLDQSTSKTTVGTIVPFYVYPTASNINPFVTAKITYPTLPIVVILNPDSGVGSAQDPNYVQAVTTLKNAGITVLGYVYTSYGQRATSSVEAEIQQWITWYQPDGIFLDEMALNHTYYQTLTQYAHNAGLVYVVGNPGTNIDVSAANDVDIINIFENGALPNLSSFQNWKTANVPISKVSFLSYNIPQLPSQSTLAQDATLFGWMYITNVSGNPWGALASYFETLAGDLNAINASQ